MERDESKSGRNDGELSDVAHKLAEAASPHSNITRTAISIFLKQDAKGVSKYGQLLDTANINAIDYALEELADLMKYLIKLKEQMQEGEGQ